MVETRKVSPQEVHDRMAAGEDVLLVCAYEQDEKFEANHLEGAISMKDLRAREADLDQETELVFYCA